MRSALTPFHLWVVFVCCRRAKQTWSSARDQSVRTRSVLAVGGAWDRRKQLHSRVQSRLVQTRLVLHSLKLRLQAEPLRVIAPGGRVGSSCAGWPTGVLIPLLRPVSRPSPKPKPAISISGRFLASWGRNNWKPQTGPFRVMLRHLGSLAAPVFWRWLWWFVRLESVPFWAGAPKRI